ncbi:MAG: thioesterase family protein [Oscillospiraceae bacterium]|nr:thioesterase family protein [Oscillospiraceae bacterium]
MQIGDTWEVSGAVTEQTTAKHIGSGGLAVFGTPCMTAMMENAAYTLLQRTLPEGRSSVGTRLDVSHVSPSPVGMRVRATAEVTGLSADGRTVDFRVAAYDDAGLIGEGRHRRVIIDTQRFMAKCSGKLQ